MNEKTKDLMEETRIALSERLQQIENTSYEERIGFDWRGHLSSLWEAVRTNFDANCPETLTELFLTQVWKISRLNVGELRLDGESKHVNVIVDNEYKLFFSNNTAYLSLAINYHEDESENLKINDHEFIKEYKNISFTGDILTVLERILEGDSKEEYPLLDLWVSYLKELKIIIDFIKQQQLKFLNLNVYNNNKYFEYYSDKLKLSGLFENYRLNLINEEINEAIREEKKVICFEKKNYEYFSRIDNTHGNALLHYEKKFKNPPHKDFISYGIQWQTDKIKFYIRSKNKKVNKIRDEYLSKFGKLLQDKVFPNGIDLKLNPNGKFKSISIHEHSMFDDLIEIPNKIIELLNCLEDIKTSINKNI